MEWLFVIQLSEMRDQLAVIVLSSHSFGSGFFDQLEDGPQTVKQTEQTADEFLRNRQLIFTQGSQQVLTRMSQLFQSRKAEKSRCAFDGVYGSEDVANQLCAVLRPYLQLSQAPLHAVETFLTLSYEFFR